MKRKLLLLFILVIKAAIGFSQFSQYNTRTLFDSFENPAQKAFYADSSRTYAFNFFIPNLSINTGIKGTSLTCFIFDRERAWGESWSDVARVLDAPFKVYPSFMQLDVTDDVTWKSYGKLAQVDLFTLSYFMSEVWRFKEEAEPFFVHCMSQMKKGSLLLFIDNNSPKFVDWFDGLAKAQNFDWLSNGTGNMSFSIDEEKTDLGIYFKKFDWPKRTSDAAYRVLKKL